MKVSKYITELEVPDAFEFKLFHSVIDKAQHYLWKKSVGVAYFVSGEKFYNLRLWTFSQEEYLLVPKDNDQKRYLIYAKDRKQLSSNTQRVRWNIVGTGSMDKVLGAIVLKFDLLARPIYLNIYSCKMLPKQLFKNKAA